MLSSELLVWTNIPLFLRCLSVHHCCQLPSAFALLSAAIVSQLKSSWWCTGIWGGHPPPSSSRRHCMSFSPCLHHAFSHNFARGSFLLPFRQAWLLTCHCYATYLKLLYLLLGGYTSCLISSPLQDLRIIVGLLHSQGTCALYPITFCILQIS